MFKHCFLLVFLAVSSVHSDEISTFIQREISDSYMDVAMRMISKAKHNIPTCNNCKENISKKPKDCADIQQMGHSRSGVYKIWPVSRLTENKSLDVYCDMDTDGGGWTVIQRRGNYQKPKDFFFKDWKYYKEGFGDIEEDFWLGNDNIFALTNQKVYSARFDLKDVTQNKRYALYNTFWIDDESNNYILHISDYSGDAGDSMISEHNNQKFSTKDKDNGNVCANAYKGAWWYKNCHLSNLNGLYLYGMHESPADGVNWYSWKGYHESLEWTEIKIRPKRFRPSCSLNQK